MGSALATNLVASGHDVITHDIAGPARNPDGAAFVDDVAEVARRAEIVVLSLPDGTVSESVVRAIVDASDRSVRLVIDTSTVGLEASELIDRSARRRRDRLRRRAGVRRHGRRQGTDAGGDVRRAVRMHVCSPSRCWPA